MYGGKTASPPTPAIDKLALAGVRLESYYVNKLCSPTRTALLSGRYAYTIGQDRAAMAIMALMTQQSMPRWWRVRCRVFQCY